MSKSARGNLSLVRKLCNNITVLQQRNTALHEQIVKMDVQRDEICKQLHFQHWQQFIVALPYLQDILNKSDKYCNPFQTQSTFQSRTQPFQAFSTDQSPFESPIQSESRIINRSIRGDTQRQNKQCELNDYQMPVLEVMNNKFKQLPKTLYTNDYDSDAFKIRKRRDSEICWLPNTTDTQNCALLNGYDIDFDGEGTLNEFVLLSIENTKLRQKIIKLQTHRNLQTFQQDQH